MVSKSQIKLITSLAQKKYRQQNALFVVEGIKGIREFLDSSYVLHSLYALEGVFEDQDTTEVSPAELKKISFLKTPQKALALFEIPKQRLEIKSGFQLVLDEVRDPGNLGTLIRLCDWYGIEHLICSEQTVDCFNPKVVQATMGSLTRVNLVYTDLETYLSKQKLPVYGAFMDGENVYRSQLPEEAILVLGNEANGVSQFGSSTTESLNVAIAGAILVSEFKRG